MQHTSSHQRAPSPQPDLSNWWHDSPARSCNATPSASHVESNVCAASSSLQPFPAGMATAPTAIGGQLCMSDWWDTKSIVHSPEAAVHSPEAAAELPMEQDVVEDNVLVVPSLQESTEAVTESTHTNGSQPLMTDWWGTESAPMLNPVPVSSATPLVSNVESKLCMDMAQGSPAMDTAPLPAPPPADDLHQLIATKGDTSDGSEELWNSPWSLVSCATHLL